MRDRASKNGFSSSDKSHIETLYREVCGKAVRNTGCNDCYKDAYIETYLKLKRTGKMPQKPNYILKAGVVIREFGSNKFYGLANCPDDVAENYSRDDEKRINLFESYPKDWHDRVFNPKPKTDEGADNGEDADKGEDESGQQAAEAADNGESNGADASAETPAEEAKPEDTPSDEAPAEEAPAAEAADAAPSDEGSAATDEADASAETPAQAKKKPGRKPKASAEN